MAQGYTKRWVGGGKSYRWRHKRKGRVLELVNTSVKTTSARPFTSHRNGRRAFYLCTISKEGTLKTEAQDEFKAGSVQEAQKRCLRMAKKYS